MVSSLKGMLKIVVVVVVVVVLLLLLLFILWFLPSFCDLFFHALYFCSNDNVRPLSSWFLYQPREFLNSVRYQ